MTSNPAIAARAFTLDDQREFARASGDFNPLHLDAQFARRTQMGAPVVHGVHTLLWALESVLRKESFAIANIRVRFHQPLFLDETAELRIAARTDTAIDLDVAAAGTTIAAIRLSSRSGKTAGVVAADAASAPQQPDHPADVPFEQMSHQRGTAVVPARQDEIQRVFPLLANTIGAPAVAALMATSQIV